MAKARNLPLRKRPYSPRVDPPLVLYTVRIPKDCLDAARDVAKLCMESQCQFVRQAILDRCVKMMAILIKNGLGRDLVPYDRTLKIEPVKR